MLRLPVTHNKVATHHTRDTHHIHDTYYIDAYVLVNRWFGEVAADGGVDDTNMW